MKDGNKINTLKNNEKSNEKMSIVGDNIRFLLKTNGMTAKTLSEIIDVGKSTVSNWVQHNKVPREESIKKIAKHFGIRPVDLYDPDLQKRYYKIINTFKDVGQNRVSFAIQDKFDTGEMPSKNGDGVLVRDVDKNAFDMFDPDFPYNSDSFDRLVKILKEDDSLLNLLKLSKGLSNDDVNLLSVIAKRLALE
jgi:transcriptional regulator with XRE-family HTH domain